MFLKKVLFSVASAVLLRLSLSVLLSEIGLVVSGKKRELEDYGSLLLFFYYYFFFIVL